MNVPDDRVPVDEKKAHLLTLANDLKTRLSSLRLEELLQLEKMDNVTAAGLGIPYFRQLLAHLSISEEDVSPADQQQIQRSILMSEIRDAISRWNLNVEMVEVNRESVRRLSGEIQMVANESGRIL
jgi:hypothetical protein